MDETPEELEQIRREAAAIDPYQYRRRRRLMAAVALGAFGALLSWGVLELADRRRNPCQRVSDHFCQGDKSASRDCAIYRGLFRESVDDASATMRSLIRQQCETKIRRMKEEDGVAVH
jgi:hypothetical protein